MKGLGGFLMGIGGFIVSLVILVLVGLYCLIASQPNLSLLYAALVQCGIMGIFLWIT